MLPCLTTSGCAESPPSGLTRSASAVASCARHDSLMRVLCQCSTTWSASVSPLGLAVVLVLSTRFRCHWDWRPSRSCRHHKERPLDSLTMTATSSSAQQSSHSSNYYSEILLAASAPSHCAVVQTPLPMLTPTRYRLTSLQRAMLMPPMTAVVVALSHFLHPQHHPDQGAMRPVPSLFCYQCPCYGMMVALVSSLLGPGEDRAHRRVKAAT